MATSRHGQIRSWSLQTCVGAPSARDVWFFRRKFTKTRARAPRGAMCHFSFNQVSSICRMIIFCCSEAWLVFGLFLLYTWCGNKIIHNIHKDTGTSATAEVGWWYIWSNLSKHFSKFSKFSNFSNFSKWILNYSCWYGSFWNWLISTNNSFQLFCEQYFVWSTFVHTYLV